MWFHFILIHYKIELQKKRVSQHHLPSISNLLHHHGYSSKRWNHYHLSTITTQSPSVIPLHMTITRTRIAPAITETSASAILQRHHSQCSLIMLSSRNFAWKMVTRRPTISREYFNSSSTKKKNRTLPSTPIVHWEQ